MGRGRIRFGIAVFLLLCSACGQRQGDVSAKHETLLNLNSASEMPTTVVKQTPPTARGAPHPLEQVLRFPNPGEAGWKQWITYSKSEKGDEKEELYRIPGDSFSKYYEVHLYSGQGDESSDILDDTNNIVGDLGWYADLVGIRKTPQAITVFAYYFSNGDPENDEGLGGYQIGRIEHGRVKHFRCVITKETLELAVGRHFGTRRQLVAASEENATAVVDLLTSSEPQMKRDHCS